MATRKPKIEYGIVCDDIRQEIGHKLSFLGVYGREPNIIVPTLPFLFPKLCFALSVKNVKGGDSFSVKLVNPSQKQFAQTINGNVPEGTKLQHTIPLYPTFSPLQVETEGAHHLVIVFDEDEDRSIVFKFNIRLAEKKE